ncbi:MAG: hypothetical protein ABMA64_13135 [Myxococcota bacterium]
MWMTVAVSGFAQPLVAVVVLDQAARDQGYAVELEEWVIDDVLPVDVREGERVRIVDPDGGRHELDVAPGEAWEIAGPHGEAWMSRLGEEIRTDVIEVRGERASVQRLAESLGATLRIDGDRALLIRDDVLFDAPWVDAEVDALDEVRLVRVDATRAPTRTATSAPTRTATSAPTRSATSAPTSAPSSVAAPSAALSAPSARVEVNRCTLDPRSVAPPEVAEPPRPVAVEPVPEPLPPDAEARWALLDPAPYVGLFLCGDGTPLLLSASGAYSVPEQNGQWVVSAPGMIHLLVDGVDVGRAAIEVDRRHCRAVW